MILSLANILDTQQVDKPAINKQADNSKRISLTEPKKFKDHLEISGKAKSEPDNIAAESPVVGVTPAAINNIPLANNADNTENFAQQVVSAAVQAIASEPTTGKTAGEILLQQQEVLNSAFDALKGIKDAGTVIQPQLISNQESTTNIANINVEDTENAGKNLSADNLTALTSDENTIKLAEQIISGVQNVETQTTENAANKEKISLSGIASTILDIATTSAAAPVVVQTDVKSAQIDSLLKGVKDSEKTEGLDNDANIQAVTKEEATKPVVNQLSDGQKQQNTQNQTNVANNQIAQNQAAANDVHAETHAQKNNATSSKAEPVTQTAPDALLQASLSNSSDIAPADNLFKFQKYVNATDNVANNMNANRTAAENVIAQIKFGVSSLSKTDSTISIQLHPKDLGSVDVRMEIGHDGKTKVSIMAEKTDTLNLLQKEASSLKNMLQDALHTEPGQLNFSFHQSNDDQWKQMINQAFNGYNKGSPDIDDELLGASAIYQRNFIASDGLDIRV
ncbi:MAG: hypothetical protein K0R98_597 [Rickettsiaceae bacterium]|nr:hypothetical protein [Rickettsiaceae bacterium]